MSAPFDNTDLKHDAEQPRVMEHFASAAELAHSMMRDFPGANLPIDDMRRLFTGLKRNSVALVPVV